MPITNPELTPIESAKIPVVATDYSDTLKVAGQIAEGVLNNRQERIVNSFKETLSQDPYIKKYSTELNTFPLTPSGDISVTDTTSQTNLTPEDINVTNNFQNKMDKLINVVNQSGTRSAQTMAMIQADRLVSEQSMKYPKLSAAFRQQAAMLLGQDPSGSRAQLIEQMNKIADKTAQDELKRIQEYATQIGVRQTLIPGSPEWTAEFIARDRQHAEAISARDIAFISEAQNKINAGNTAAQYINNPNGTYAILNIGFQQITDALNMMDEGQWSTFSQGKSTIKIGGKDYTNLQLGTFLDDNINQLQKDIFDISTTNPDASDRLKPLVEYVSSYTNSIKSVMANTQENRLKALRFMNDFLSENIINGLTKDQRSVVVTAKLLESLMSAVGTWPEGTLFKAQLGRLFSNAAAAFGLTSDQFFDNKNSKFKDPNVVNSMEIGFGKDLESLKVTYKALAEDKYLSPEDKKLLTDTVTGYMFKLLSAINDPRIKNKPELADIFSDLVAQDGVAETLSSIYRQGNMNAEFANFTALMRNRNNVIFSQLRDEITRPSLYIKSKGQNVPARNIFTMRLNAEGNIELDTNTNYPESDYPTLRSKQLDFQQRINNRFHTYLNITKATNKEVDPYEVFRELSNSLSLLETQK
jgi:hypothetical protein